MHQNQHYATGMKFTAGPILHLPNLQHLPICGQTIRNSESRLILHPDSKRIRHQGQETPPSRGSYVSRLAIMISTGIILGGITDLIL